MKRPATPRTIKEIVRDTYARWPKTMALLAESERKEGVRE